MYRWAIVTEQVDSSFLGIDGGVVTARPKFQPVLAVPNYHSELPRRNVDKPDDVLHDGMTQVTCQLITRTPHPPLARPRMRRPALVGLGRVV